MKAVFLTMSLALSFNVMALPTYVCTHGDATRIIDVVYTEPGQLVPCEVQYTKSTGPQVLWRAQSQEGYCEEKAQAFAEKQEGFGWQCAQMSAENDGSLETMESQPVDTESEAVSMEPEAMASESMQTKNMDHEAMEPASMEAKAMEPVTQTEEQMKMVEPNSVESNDTSVQETVESQMTEPKEQGEMTESN